MAPVSEEVAAVPASDSPEFSILKQRVDLDIDFVRRSVKGSTEITVIPFAKELKQIKLHCRQCRPTAIQADGLRAKWDYTDPYRRAHMPEKSTVHQHDMLKAKIENSLRPTPQPELTVTLPPKLKIQEMQNDPAAAPIQNDLSASTQKHDGDAMAETPTVQSAQQQALQFHPIKLSIEFEVASFRDGIHWVGWADGDRRYPYMYTKVEPWCGNSSCIFPCVDDATSRSSWEIAIRCPRTLGDAFRVPKLAPEDRSDQVESAADTDIVMSNGIDAATNGNASKSKRAEEYLIDLADDEVGLDLVVVCVGELVDDSVDSEDETRHTVIFNLPQEVTARHIGFAIGPFENVDLSSTRDSDEEEKMGQSAIKVDGYCLPGKSKDLHNTCYPLAWAVDNMAIKYGSFPFSTYQLLFIDDFVFDSVAAAGLSLCNSNLLFPVTIIEPIYRNTRILVRALAEQWIGVNVIAKEPVDEWVVAGIAGFMTDAYMKDLCGNNEFRWQQKIAAEKVYELDVDRPSIRVLGELLHLDQSIRDFVNVKSALVLFILDRRLMKTTGQTGVQRIINKIFLNARTGALANGEVSTTDFQRTCERLGHNKLEAFFRQWVFHSGCPIFHATQRFNKKKLVVEMTIVQRQLERRTKPQFEPSNFMREVKEYVQEVWAPETNPVFTGPMTIRIHEADGTPYEHIVEIKESTTRLEIPYNTKYKRLKRSRRQKERQMAEGVNVEGGDDALLHCLGGILGNEDEMNEWNLTDWTEEQEAKMGQESYEWIRMDADFEWIGKIHLDMPVYMYVSQLQQDRDIVAQYESLRYLLGSKPDHVGLSILVRTLMDDKYFWGIREMAAEGLAICAKDKWREVGQFHLVKAFRELFCIGGTNMPKSNDFSDRRNFIIQCAIPKAMAKLRDEDGKVPMHIRQFFVDLLKFNDNSNNKIDDGDAEELTYSDNHYVATLMRCLADSLIASHREPQATYTFSFDGDEPMEPEDNPDADFEKLAIAQIERHRRIDEWDPSYQNVYSITALDCLQELTKAGIVKDKTKELMQYVRSGNADNVRTAAWHCLSEIGVLRKMAAMRYLLHCLADDASPRFRYGLLKIFGEALGHIALDDNEPEKKQPQPIGDGGLVLEQEPTSEARRLEATRKTSAEGALPALKEALLNQNMFKESLWNAATSPDLSIDEIAALCDIAALIYDPVESLTLTLKLPRKWRCENMGQGKVKFTAHGPYRTTPRKELIMLDWQKLQDLGMRYEGPLAADVRKKQKDNQDTIQLKLKNQIVETQQQLQDVQGGSVAVEMPPPLVTPSTEKSGIRLSLGSKRKQSVDLGVQERAGSPKAPKLSRQQTPTGRAQSPRAKGSPAASQRRSVTPGSRPAMSKAKGSKTVILRLGNSASKAQEILSTPPQPDRNASPAQSQSIAQPSRSITPVLPPSSAFPATLLQSPTNSMNYFDNAAFGGATPNLGSFRSYDPSPAADVPAPIVKQESTEMSQSPIIASPVNGFASPMEVLKQETPVLSSEETKHDMPPPPRPKLTLKLGARRPSASQGSPDQA